MAHWRLAGLTLLGVAFLACWWHIRALGDLRLSLGAFYGWFAAAFALYLLVLWLVQRWERTDTGTCLFSGSGKNRNVPILLAVMLLVAVGGRLLLLGTTPTLSDDIYRYQWDGRVQLAGIDPYAYPPDAPELAHLRDAASAQINFPSLRTVYPPVTELAFRLGARWGDTLTAQKAVFVLAELAVGLGLLMMLRQRGRSALWIAAYAWHPLVILEIAGSGHNDTLALAGLWLGLACWQGRRWLGSATAWAVAVLAKLLPVILIPWWWCRRERRGGLGLFVLLSLLPLVWLPTFLPALIESFSAMTVARTASNASGYLLLAAVVGRAGAAPLAALGIWATFLLWWARREADPARYLFGGMLAAVLLSPALHPWYLVWVVPFFCFWRVPAALLLTGTVVLAYAVWPGYLADGVWTLPAWARAAEYGPVLLLLLWEMRRCVWRSSFLPATKPLL